jgi:uncharacterized damage-inducible protein DinB
VLQVCEAFFSLPSSNVSSVSEENHSGGTVQETAQQYTQRLLSYVDGKDPLRLQQAAPKKLAALIKGKKKEQLSRRPEPGKWSVAEVMAHLADAEIAISWRLRQVLSSSGVSIEAYDQDSWARTFDYARRDPRQSLESFRLLRENNIALLKAVPRKLWDNYGVHSERGKESVAHIARMVAGHDVNHLQQVERVLRGTS